MQKKTTKIYIFYTFPKKVKTNTEMNLKHAGLKTMDHVDRIAGNITPVQECSGRFDSKTDLQIASLCQKTNFEDWVDALALRGETKQNVSDTLNNIYNMAHCFGRHVPMSYLGNRT